MANNALKQVNDVTPDIILLDVMMPGIDGFETCRRLKTRAETKDIPVIFITALSDAVDKVKGLNIGAVDYVTKPLQQEEVLARVNTHLTIRKLQRSLEEKNQVSATRDCRAETNGESAACLFREAGRSRKRDVAIVAECLT